MAEGQKCLGSTNLTIKFSFQTTCVFNLLFINLKIYISNSRCAAHTTPVALVLRPS